MSLIALLHKNRTLLPQEIGGPIATLYEKVATPGLRQFHRQVASEITSSLTSGSLLDAGTGPGHLLVEIARQNPDLNLTGCDLSRKMLKIAKKTFQANGLNCAESLTEPEATTANTNTGIHLVKADVRELPFPDNTFDLVVSTLSIHHWHDPARGIRECLRVTAPGGRCWIYDLRSDVSAGTHAKFIGTEGFSRWVLGWIFKFHTIEPEKYQAHKIASWLDSNEKVQVRTHPAFLKLDIEKPLGKPQDRMVCSKNTSSANSVTPQ